MGAGAGRVGPQVKNTSVSLLRIPEVISDVDSLRSLELGPPLEVRARVRENVQVAKEQLEQGRLEAELAAELAEGGQLRKRKKGGGKKKLRKKKMAAAGAKKKMKKKAVGAA